METTWIISSAVWRWSHSWPQCFCWPEGMGRLESHLVVAVYLCRFFTLDGYSEILRRKRELYAYCRYETRRVEELADLAKLLPTALTGLCDTPGPEERKPQSWPFPVLQRRFFLSPTPNAAEAHPVSAPGCPAQDIRATTRAGCVMLPCNFIPTVQSEWGIYISRVFQRCQHMNLAQHR